MLVLQTILPLFILIALGFALTRFRVLPDAAPGALSLFVIYLALPALLFRALSGNDDTAAMNGGLMAGYIAGSLTWLVVALALARALRVRGTSVAAYATAATYSNSAFIGLPVGLSLIGPQAATLAAFFISFEMIVLLPLMMVLAEWHDNQGRLGEHLLGVARRLLGNPLILAIIAGGLFGALAIPLPKALLHSLDLLAAACAPVALVYIGCTLAKQRLSQLAGPAATITCGKLLLHPLFVCLAFWLMPSGDITLEAAAVVNAAMPIATVFPVLAVRYGREEVLSGAVVATTAVSFVTISLWIAMMGLS
ncbi:AEC family transporter [Parahaliea mediterranea]|uniref:AEC family transporter n=1 Tax=Parahaliea mediterranea TaxID=651086 RepID=A0A939DCZ2_9GAMM|nr:AEC family transporter [Parahaliea mediterranea]MBN7795297.1 AEC family transporter [Parahaliea mediterranea]